MRGLGIADALLNFLELVLNVTIGHQDVRPAVVVVVEKETAESKRNQRSVTDFRAGSFIDEQAVALIVIEREHLVGKIGDDDTGMTGAVVIGGIDTHSSPGHAIFAESDARRNAALFKGSVLFIQVKLVGLRVVGQQNVGPAV